MKIVLSRREVLVLLACFILSRICIKLVGVSFGFDALFSYWQYLDVDSLQNNLLYSLWYQHAQPPAFNFLAGIVLKCSGQYAHLVFELLFLGFSFFNACLLLNIISESTRARKLSLIVALLYMLSPATMLFENELFYTSFISMLLLLTVHALIAFQRDRTWTSAVLMFLFMVLLCLTKSLYHLAWFVLVAGALLFRFYKTPAFKKVVVTALTAVVVVTGWYAKNLLLFNSFSASSWTGMNFARIVFHEVEIKDSSNIASIPPFYPIKYYKRYVSAGNEKRYEGWNDKVLLDQIKNDSFNNLNHLGYLQVSRQYMRSGWNYVREHPSTYIKHLATSFVIFFTPASSYFRVVANNRKIWPYDMVYSFNLSHFSASEQSRKSSLAISAIPKCLAYLFVLFAVVRNAFIKRYICSINVFALITVLFVLGVSTCFEYGENMRFRYEVEPIFLIMAAQVVAKKFRPVGDDQQKDLIFFDNKQ